MYQSEIFQNMIKNEQNWGIVQILSLFSVTIYKKSEKLISMCYDIANVPTETFVKLGTSI